MCGCPERGGAGARGSGLSSFASGSLQGDGGLGGKGVVGGEGIELSPRATPNPIRQQHEASVERSPIFSRTHVSTWHMACSYLKLNGDRTLLHGDIEHPGGPRAGLGLRPLGPFSVEALARPAGRQAAR